ncbi:hypothetical protein J1N35_040746 [Gossypium stocksii]|uniref:Uncharacterized protein n=1 Tax=Gossypium stocksii TaxID=47602 RepID=A0A9D3UEP3_9ROSI|nr:hypothetical protein J1N35_040746 [Gossypium stocksii]
MFRFRVGLGGRVGSHGAWNQRGRRGSLAVEDGDKPRNHEASNPVETSAYHCLTTEAEMVEFHLPLHQFFYTILNEYGITPRQLVNLSW